MTYNVGDRVRIVDMDSVDMFKAYPQLRTISGEYVVTDVSRPGVYVYRKGQVAIRPLIGPRVAFSIDESNLIPARR